MNCNRSWYSFSLENASKYFKEDEQSEISVNGVACDFSVDHSLVKKEDVLNIHKYLMVSNNIKKFLILLKNIYQIINLYSYGLKSYKMFILK